MASVVWNPLEEPVTTKMRGAWFTFKADQKKVMDDTMCQFIEQKRRETGLVVLPGEFLDKDMEIYDGAYGASPEGQEKLKQARQLAINNIVEFHRGIIYNLQVSLKRDLSKSGDGSVDPLHFASEGELESMRIVAKHQKAQKDEIQKKVNEARELLKKVGPLEG